MAKGFRPLDHERLDVAQGALERLVRGFRATHQTNVTAADRERMRLMESALQHLDAARLVK